MDQQDEHFHEGHPQAEPRSVWDRIRADPIALAKIKYDPHIRFDIDHENVKTYVNAHFGRVQPVVIEVLRAIYASGTGLKLPDCGDDVLVIRFKDAKMLRVSASFIKYHSNVIREMTSNPKMMEGEEPGELHLKSINYKTFKDILRILYYPARYFAELRLWVRLLRAERLESLLVAVDFLGMSEVKGIIENGMQRLPEVHQLINAIMIHLAGKGGHWFGMRQPGRGETFVCKCEGIVCAGSVCGKIEDEEIRNIVESTPGKYAIHGIASLIYIFDRYGMHHIILRIFNEYVTSKNMSKGSQGNMVIESILSRTAGLKVSQRTYEIIIHKLVHICEQGNKPSFDGVPYPMLMGQTEMLTMPVE
jgi:hypothetical protein